MNTTNNESEIIVKQIRFPGTTYQFLRVIGLGGLVLFGAYNVFGNGGENTFKMCQESFMKASNEIVRYNIDNPKYTIKLPNYNCTQNLNATGGIAPEPPKFKEIKDIDIEPLTMRDRFGLGNCRFINSNHAIPSKNLKWMAYDIACLPGKPFEVRSPGYYILESIGYGNNLGNYIILKKVQDNTIDIEQTRIVLGHTVTDSKVGDTFGYDDVVGKTNLSGASTGVHLHIELWIGYTNVSREYALGEKYESLDGSSLLNNRKWDFGQPKSENNKYYFTHYDLGDKAQNDSSPCIGASGKDLCYLADKGVKTMALTSDIRLSMGIKFGDTIQLVGDKGCEGFYQVEDEMNKRFRQTPGVLRPGTNYYIKGDLSGNKGGACSIFKLNN